MLTNLKSVVKLGSRRIYYVFLFRAKYGKTERLISRISFHGWSVSKSTFITKIPLYKCKKQLTVRADNAVYLLPLRPHVDAMFFWITLSSTSWTPDICFSKHISIIFGVVFIPKVNLHVCLPLNFSEDNGDLQRR